jgi:hypothetical protein
MSKIDSIKNSLGNAKNALNKAKNAFNARLSQGYEKAKSLTSRKKPASNNSQNFGDILHKLIDEQARISPSIFPDNTSFEDLHKLVDEYAHIHPSIFPDNTSFEDLRKLLDEYKKLDLSKDKPNVSIKKIKKILDKLTSDTTNLLKALYVAIFIFCVLFITCIIIFSNYLYKLKSQLIAANNTQELCKNILYENETARYTMYTIFNDSSNKKQFQRKFKNISITIFILYGIIYS